MIVRLVRAGISPGIDAAPNAIRHLPADVQCSGTLPSATRYDTQRLSGLDVVDHGHRVAGRDGSVRAFAGEVDQSDQVRVCELAQLPLLGGEPVVDLDGGSDAVSLACRIGNGVPGGQQFLHDAVGRAAMRPDLAGRLLHGNAFGPTDPVGLDFDQEIENLEQAARRGI